jgi:hypothetical protein
MKNRFPHDGREMTKLVRDVCEIVGRQAFARVGELSSVRVRLPDGDELFETISLGPGQSTTLEFYSPKKKNNQDGGSKGQIGPRNEEGVMGEWMMKPPPQPVLKSAFLGAGIGFSALGLGMLVGGMGFSIYANAKLDSTKAEDGRSCRLAGNDGRVCPPLYDKLLTSTNLFYLGTGTTLLGAGGLMVYALYPSAPERNPALQSFAPRLPMGLGVSGHW